MSKKYTTNFLEDTNGSTGSANQVLISTAAGIDWVDGSGSGIIGGPYLPLSAGSSYPLTGNLTIDGGSITVDPDAAGAVFTWKESDSTTVAGQLRGYANRGDIYLYSDGIKKTELSSLNDSFIPALHIGGTTAASGGGLQVTGQGIFTGNVGIGTTSPLGNLQIGGSAGAGGTSALFSGFTGVSHGSLKMYAYGNNTPTIQLSASDSGTGSGATYFNSGNVGIGTTIPGAKLSVVGTSSITGTLTLGTTAGSNLNMLRASANYINATNATGYLVFRTSGYDTALILDTSQNATFAGNVTTGGQVTVPTGYSVNIGTSRIHSAATSYLLGGNVGIGTTTPTFKLHVNSTDASDNVAYIHHNNAAQSSGDVLKVRSDAGDNAGSALLNVANNTGSALYVRGDRNVGIGTTSPDVRLEVVEASPTDGIVADFVNSTNAGGTTAAIKLSNADSDVCDVVLGANRVSANFGSDFFISLSDGVDGSNQERFRITEAGNVGIGEDTPNCKLDVKGAVNTTIIAATTLGDGGGAANRGLAIRTDTDGGEIATVGTGTNMYLNTANNLYLQNASNTKVTMLANGNVGIGTTSPDTKLHVEGNVLIDAYNQGEDNGLFFREGFLTIDQPSITVWDMSNAGASPDGLSINSNDGIRFRENLGEVARFKDGNFGIGTTTPIVKLDVVGTARFADVSPRIVLQETGTAKDFSLKINTDGRLSVLNDNLVSEVLTIKQDGNVGIGDTTPEATLTVKKGSEGAYFSAGGDTANNRQLVFTSSNGNGSNGAKHQINATSSNGIIALATANVDRLTVGNTGNVGIGETSPDQKLHVKGGDIQTEDTTGANGVLRIRATITGTPSTGGYPNVGAGDAVIEGGGTTQRQPGVITLMNGDSSISSGQDLGVIQFVGKDDSATGYCTSQIISTTSGAMGAGVSGGGILRFLTSPGSTGATPQEAMRITNTGNVGIGVTNPSWDLDVAGDIRIRDQGKLYFGNSGSIPYLQIYSDSNNNMVIDDVYTNNADVLFSIQGNIGVGKAIPTAKLDVVGDGRFTSTVTATNFILSSDKRLKNNVEEVSYNHIDVNWKTFETKSEKGQSRYGVIAQELEEVHPEFVRTDEQGMKSVAYIDLLIAKIAELEARLEKLEK